MGSPTSELPWLNGAAWGDGPPVGAREPPWKKEKVQVRRRSAPWYQEPHRPGYSPMIPEDGKRTGTKTAPVYHGQAKGEHMRNSLGMRSVWILGNFLAGGKVTLGY